MKVTTKKTSKKDKIAILEAELAKTKFELAEAQAKLKEKEYDEFFEESYRFYMTRYGDSLREIEELKKENKTLQNVVKAIESFTEELQRQNWQNKTENK